MFRVASQFIRRRQALGRIRGNKSEYAKFAAGFLMGSICTTGFIYQHVIRYVFD